MRYEDSMKGVADQIIKEQQRASKIKNNPEEFHWHDEYATLNFFRFVCKNIGNLGNGEIEKMVTRLKSIDQKAVENHVNGAVWAFDYGQTPAQVPQLTQEPASITNWLSPWLIAPTGHSGSQVPQLTHESEITYAIDIPSL